MTVPDNAQAAYWYPNYEDGGRQQYTITNAELTAATNVTVDIYITGANNPEIFDDCLSTGYDILLLILIVMSGMNIIQRTGIMLTMMLYSRF